MSDRREIEIPKTVYIRAVARSELPAELLAQVTEDDAPYAVFAPNGDRLAIVKDQKLAFILARQNDLTPVYVN